MGWIRAQRRALRSSRGLLATFLARSLSLSYCSPVQNPSVTPFLHTRPHFPVATTEPLWCPGLHGLPALFPPWLQRVASQSPYHHSPEVTKEDHEPLPLLPSFLLSVCLSVHKPISPFPSSCYQLVSPLPYPHLSPPTSHSPAPPVSSIKIDKQY